MLEEEKQKTEYNQKKITNICLLVGGIIFVLMKFFNLTFSAHSIGFLPVIATIFFISVGISMTVNSFTPSTISSIETFLLGAVISFVWIHFFDFFSLCMATNIFMILLTISSFLKKDKDLLKTSAASTVMLIIIIWVSLFVFPNEISSLTNLFKP